MSFTGVAATPVLVKISYSLLCRNIHVPTAVNALIPLSDHL